MKLPISDKIRMSPTWARRQRRVYLHGVISPPSTEEILDAISVLGDPDSERLAPALYLEAFRIFEEASV